MGDHRGIAPHGNPRRGTARDHPSRAGRLHPARDRRDRPDAPDRTVEEQRRTPTAGQPRTGQRAGIDHLAPARRQRRRPAADRALRRARKGHRAAAAAPVPAPHRERLWKTFNYSTVQKFLSDTLARTGLTDAAGAPLCYTPHDFRRLWATAAVSNGLPVHIAAKLLGHKNTNTTQTYVAVFDEHLVRSYRSFLDTRRALRPQAEYREPTEQEWREFQQHFELRKLELGTCARPYGSPCRHEQWCIRCPSLQLDPRARPRLTEIIANLGDRITEAKTNGWTGEVEGLRVSVNAAATKLASLDQLHERSSCTTHLTELGMPVIESEPPP
ncbi:tyrosine-type recombinase/integrase [Nocardia sp. NPDC004711]